MNGLDWAIIAILVVSVITAAAQGFFFELFSFIGAVVGYLLAAWEYPRVAGWLLPYMKNQWAAEAAGFLLIFIGVLILAGIVGRVARWAVSSVGLRIVDRFLGGVFGLLRGALVVMVLVLVMASFGTGARMLATSQLGEYFLVLGRAAMWASPYELRDKFRDGLKMVSDIREHGTSGIQKSSETSPTNDKK